MDSIIRYLLRRVPRKYLQLFQSGFFRKLLAWFLYGKKIQCPVCSHTFHKLLPYGRISARQNALCPNCLSLERHRLIWLYLQRQTTFFTEQKNVLHIAPEICFVKKFKQTHSHYVTADLESPWADVKMDIHHMPFDNGSFDVVLCNHVLEHVEDDRRAMAEIFRVLKKDGMAILQVPFFEPVPDTTVEDKTITDPLEREKKFGQDDHVRLYGKDYATRLREAGFHVQEILPTQFLSEEETTYYAVMKNEILYVASKQ